MKSVLLLFAVSVLIHAQANTAALQQQIAQDFEKMKSSDANQRIAAFDDIASIGCPSCNHSAQPILDGIESAIHSGAVTHDDMSARLIALLTTEAAYDTKIQDAFDKSGASIAPENYYDYIGDLIMAVVHMRDPRSLNALMYFIDSGNMATSAIASFGDAALEQVLPLIDSPIRQSHFGHRSGLRHPAYTVLSKMVEAKNLQNFTDPPAARARIKDRLMTAAGSEPDIWARQGQSEG